MTQRINDTWNEKLQKWQTKRLGPKKNKDFFDEYNGLLSEKVLLGHWHTESTCDGSTIQRQRALRNAIVHMTQKQFLHNHQKGAHYNE